MLKNEFLLYLLLMGAKTFGHEKVVILNLHKIDDKKANKIFQSDCRNVEHLELRNNLISSWGLMNFSKAKWINLTDLNLSHNNIGSKGCKFLSKAIFPKIAIVDLKFNQIQSEGVLHLSKANWTAIKILYLQHNTIGVNGSKWLILSRFNKMKKIYLNNNLLTKEEYLLFLLSDKLVVCLYYFAKDLAEANKLSTLVQLKGLNI